MSQPLKIARVAGTDVFVRWSWLLILALITWSLSVGFQDRFPDWERETVYLTASVTSIMLSLAVLVHELAHSLTARRLGLPVRSITLTFFGGVAELGQEPRNARSELLVTAAGPLASLALAGLLAGAAVISRGIPAPITAVLSYLALLNLFLAAFNLIPGYPLDGGRILRAIVWRVTGSLQRATHIVTSSGQVVGLLFIAGGVAEIAVTGQIIGGIWLAIIGVVVRHSASAVRNQAALDEALRGITVRDVMRRPPAAYSPTILIAVLASQLSLEDKRPVPIVEDSTGHLAGFVRHKELDDLPRDLWSARTADDLLTPMAEITTISPDDDLRRALATRSKLGQDVLPVVEADRLVGIVDRADVLWHLHAYRRETGGASEYMDEVQQRAG